MALLKEKEKVYGIADKAWQPVVGCDPAMPCAPRCWARKTVARVVECQRTEHSERAEFFQIALTPDLAKWSGEVTLDEAHLLDPVKWRKPALIATGFHGDWGRLSRTDMRRVLSIAGKCPQHRLLFLTKVPQRVYDFIFEWSIETLHNVSFGCSVMYQQGEFGADQMCEPMRQLAALGWATHVWYEPALGPVNWKGWEFLMGVISGGESGLNSRPSQARWHQDTRDWCIANGIPFNMKQWGDWLPGDQDGAKYGGCQVMNCCPGPVKVGKRVAGRFLDGRTWDGVPAFTEVRA